MSLIGLTMGTIAQEICLASLEVLFCMTALEWRLQNGGNLLKFLYLDSGFFLLSIYRRSLHLQSVALLDLFSFFCSVLRDTSYASVGAQIVDVMNPQHALLVADCQPMTVIFLPRMNFCPLDATRA